MTKEKEKQEQESLEWLRERVKPGDTIYCILRHVSRSGMSRDISFYILKDGNPVMLDYHISRVLTYHPLSKKEGVKVGGCGMDMGFAVVHSLNYALHGNESVGEKAKDAEKRGVPLWDTDAENYRAGYSLNHEWL